MGNIKYSAPQWQPDGILANATLHRVVCIRQEHSTQRYTVKFKVPKGPRIIYRLH